MPPVSRAATVASATLVLTVVVTACTGGGASPGASTSAPSPSTAPPVASAVPSAPAFGSPAASSGTDGPSPSPAVSVPAGATLTQPWATATLSDVATGETFRIADLTADGRTVFVEMMAIWCTTCRRQQGEFTDALARLDPAEVAYVVLDVEPSETADGLAAYRDDQGFEGRYAIAGPDLSRVLVDEFGPNAINPPTVPKIIVAPDGTVTFETGAESADDIVARVGG